MTKPDDASPGDRRVQRLDQLARDVQPARDLWPSIESRLDEPRPRAMSRVSPRWVPWLAFASMATLAVVAVLMTGEPRSPEIGVAATDEAKYESERAALIAEMPARIAALPADARPGATAGLEAIRHAEAELQVALGEGASDPLLLEMLIAVRQEEMRVMTHLQDNEEQERML